MLFSIKPTTIIKGNYVDLRPMEISDTDNIILWRNKPRVRDNFVYRKPFTREGHIKWIESMIDIGKAVQFVIIEKSTDKAIGSTYLRDIRLRAPQSGIWNFYRC